jgi:hypothetical protein
MMMTQWGLAQTEHSARGGKLFRASVFLIALGIALFWGGATTTAAAHPMPMRHASVARQISSAPTSHARLNSRASRAHVVRHPTGNSASRDAALKSNRLKNKPSQHTRDVPIGKREMRSRRQRHRESIRSDTPDPPALHRARASRSGSAGRGKLVPHKTASLAPTPASTALDQTISQPTAGKNFQAEGKSLTVGDFLRAASTSSTPAAAPYASGESHPDENVSSSEMAGPTNLATVPGTRRSTVLARVEATPAEDASLALERTAPADVVGAPLSAPERDAPAAARQKDSAPSSLRPPSRQELTEEVEQPLVLPGLYRNGRLVVPAALRGSREILIHQNTMADDEGLQRVQDDYELRRMRTSRQLVDFPESASLHVNSQLASNRRCARPWAVRFASDMARDYYARFHEPLQLNSAVRTVAYQVRLRRVNGNAAGVDGEAASPHLTGEALDFGKRGMSMQQIAWMRTYLLPLMQGGKLDVEEEFQQSCFHISVYRAYLPATRHRAVPRSEVAQLREPREPRTAIRSDQDQ